MGASWADCSTTSKRSPARPTPGAPAAEPVRFLSFVSRQVNVDVGGANIVGDAANEPSITVDPKHPNHMAIGWRQFDTVTSNFREAGYAYTRDGGLTWTFPPDPVTRTCHLFKSINGGMTWTPAVFAYGGDKEWMAIDRSDGPGRGQIYRSWNPVHSDFGDDFFIRSVDEGASFEYPSPCLPRRCSAPWWWTRTASSSSRARSTGWPRTNMYVFAPTMPETGWKHPPSPQCPSS